MQLPGLEHNPQKGDRNSAQGHMQVLQEDGNNLEDVVLTVSAVIAVVTEDREDQSLVTSGKKAGCSSTCSQCLNGQQGWLQILRKDQSNLNSTSTPRGRSDSGKRLPPTVDRVLPHLPNSLATCRGLLLVKKLQTDWQGLSCVWIISPCCSSTWTQILTAASVKTHYIAPGARQHLHNFATEGERLREVSTLVNNCRSITSSAAGMTRAWSLQPQDTLWG